MGHVDKAGGGGGESESCVLCLRKWSLSWGHSMSGIMPHASQSAFHPPSLRDLKRPIDVILLQWVYLPNQNQWRPMSRSCGRSRSYPSQAGLIHLLDLGVRVRSPLKGLHPTPIPTLGDKVSLSPLNQVRPCSVGDGKRSSIQRPPRSGEARSRGSWSSAARFPEAGRFALV